MPTPSPLVLLSNDDGYASAGIRAMREALKNMGAHVVILAPEHEQSASSHALSLHRPLRLRDTGDGIFALDGTPADCVYVALHAARRILPRMPDMVVAGVNHGLNLGQDAFYSGTIAAAREGALRGIPAVAVSAHPTLEMAVAARLGAAVARALLESDGRSGRLLNLNIPPDWNGRLRATRLGARIYDEIVDFRVDPRGREYLWIGGPGVRHERNPGSDTDAYDDGEASLTPLSLDLTDVHAGSLVTSIAERARQLHEPSSAAGGPKREST